MKPGDRYLHVNNESIIIMIMRCFSWIDWKSQPVYVLACLLIRPTIVWTFTLCSWEFFSCFLVINFFKILSEIPSECQTDWIQIMPDILSSLIWVQTVCKSYIFLNEQSEQDLKCLQIFLNMIQKIFNREIFLSYDIVSGSDNEPCITVD